MTVKTCNTCKWSHRTICGLECEKFRNPVSVNIVTGKVVKGYRYLCETERGHNGDCKLSGRGWEQRETLWDKIVERIVALFN